MLLLYIDFFEKTLYNIITLKAFTELIHKRTIQKEVILYDGKLFNGEKE